MCIGLHVKYPLLLSDFNEAWIFDKFSKKNPEISSLLKIRPMGAELFHADGQTGRYDDANSCFSHFCGSAK
jgi:hypothetical protein